MSRPRGQLSCYHCALPVPQGVDLSVRIDGSARPMCCHGCAAVARAIVAGGLGEYYRTRTAPPPSPADPSPELVPDALRGANGSVNRVFDDPRVQGGLVHATADGQREAALVLGGITCAACVWLNEQTLQALPGVCAVNVNYATRRARVRWDPARVQLGQILDAVQKIGYTAHPYDPSVHEHPLEKERRTALRRLGLAVALGMQVMMLAIALYAGAMSGMQPDLRALLTWSSALLTVPILMFCAVPFFTGALRSLAHGRIGMDVPIAIGIGLAFTGSLWSLWTGAGAVYFDSVAMFTVFLLAARYLEADVSRRGVRHLESLLQAVPRMARRLDPDGVETHSVPAADLQPGDRVLVLPGETVPADGQVLAGASSVNEALLTGESMPRARHVGDRVSGGSVNVESVLEVLVERCGEASLLARIVSAVEQAQRARPDAARLADRVAALFLAAVLVLAAGVALVWWHLDPDRWLSITVAVLVATCPCALSLAMPAAFTAGAARLARSGLVATRAGAIEALANATHVYLDKTGTLSTGRPCLSRTWHVPELHERAVLVMAAALERRSEHPLGAALLRAAGSAIPAARAVSNEPGAGLTGCVAGRVLWLGDADYIARRTGARPPPAALAALAGGSGTVAWLADRAGLLAGFSFEDTPRADAQRLVTTLHQQGRHVGLLSGDAPAAAQRFGRMFGIEDVRGGLDPAAKRDAILALQAEGALVAVVGDGVNDAPVLAAAQVSVAMGGGTALARASGDWVLLNDRLDHLADAFVVARRTLAVVRQNVIWAVLYNAVALPVAAMGLLAPWQAALGMSLSSALVVLNSARLSGAALAGTGPRSSSPDGSYRTAAGSVQLPPGPAGR